MPKLEKGKRGWFNESHRHSLAARGISTSRKPIDRVQPKNLSVKDKNYLGRGEFSEVWEINGRVIKRNTSSSLYNPHIWKGEKQLKRSKRAMKSEYETYQLLKKYPIMPRSMIEYEDKKGRYYLIRESGEIPLKKGQEKVFLPKWKKGSVSEKEYNLFVENIYRIAQKHGYFYDIYQPALRKDGSLFMTDLGLFITVDKAVGDFEVVKSKKAVKDAEWRIKNYREVEIQLEKLDEQIGIKHKYPDFVIKENIAYYEKEYGDRMARTPDHKILHDMTTGKYLRKWKDKATDIEIDMAFE